MKQILDYFTELNQLQQKQFEQLDELYRFWNAQINVISRKNIDQLYEHHVLYSLAIAKIIQFKKGTKIIDVGTGGGFPGIPLAILFPNVQFHLVDSIGKKIKVVENIVEKLDLKNVTAEQIRAEQIREKYDFVVSRAVTNFDSFLNFVRHLVHFNDKNSLPNGIFYLKGGDVREEMKKFKKTVAIYEIKNFFSEEFFETKNIIYKSF